MTLRLRDKWIWDFWLVRRGEEHHIFYLQAPRTLEQPSLRHHHASIGHAVSHDLRNWRVLPDALAPGPEGSWDDLATWTGSTISHNGRWYMLYTGINRSEQGLIQRIGLAVSDDLVTWEKHPANPVLEADPRWYELLDLDRWYDLSWRDPWLFQHPSSEFFHALVTARSPQGAPDGAGIVGHARSRNLVDWEVLPPLTPPGDFAQIEAPQLVSIDERYAILFSARADDHSSERVERLGIPGETGTFVLSADTMFGPYAHATGPIAPPRGPLGTLYAGKLVEVGGTRAFMAFRGYDDPDFTGELTDPLPITWDVDGRISVEYEQLETGAFP